MSFGLTCMVDQLSNLPPKQELNHCHYLWKLCGPYCRYPIGGAPATIAECIHPCLMFYHSLWRGPAIVLGRVLRLFFFGRVLRELLYWNTGKWCKYFRTTINSIPRWNCEKKNASLSGSHRLTLWGNNWELLPYCVLQWVLAAEGQANCHQWNS
jgi:hypothetical protein